MARPSWATPDRLRGRVDGATPITIQVHFPLRNLEAAKAELEAVSDPDSPQYGKYLTSEEFEAKYSPPTADVAAVRGYLESEGFEVTYVPHNNLFLSAKAAAGTVERVFSTHLGQYEADKGELRRAPMEPARLPAAIASHVSTVLGLSTARARPTAMHVGAAAATAQTPPPGVTCADYYGEYFNTTELAYGGDFPNPTPLRQCSLTAPQLRRAYGLAGAVAAGNDGRHVTVAIIDAWRTPTLVADAQAFAAQFDPTHPLLDTQIKLIDAPSGGDPTIPIDVIWYYEQLLDVESVHAIAPGANIVYVGAATSGNDDLIAAVNLVVQNNLATIISNSWLTDFEGATDDGHVALDPIIVQAGLKGIGLYFGSGDWGDNQLLYGAIIPFYPQTSPYVTTVGGTSIYLKRDGTPFFETGWESGESVPVVDSNGVSVWTPPPPGFLYFGAGGGPSARYRQPKYQRGVVPARLTNSVPMRVFPDVAMLADPDTGVPLGLTDPFIGSYVVQQGWGGTSLATPLFAATVALAEQRAGHRIGFANPRLYRLASRALRDIEPTRIPESVTDVGSFWLDTEDPSGLPVQVGICLNMPPNSCVIDVTTGGPLAPHTLHSAPGFDNVTGLGVPKGEAFLEAVSGD